MILRKDWIRRRWMDGRIGNSNYLLLSLSLINFVLITYRFLVEKNQIFEELFPNLWLFALIFLVLYFPISIIIGRWHVSTQLKIEMILKGVEAPIPAKIFRIILDIQTGRASKEEIEEVRKIINDIENT